MRWLVLAVFWLEIALVSWSASFGGSFQAGVTHMFGLDDKMLHFLAFAVVALTALWLWKPAWLVVAVLFVFAASIEAVQRTLPGREASLADLGASAAGLLAAWALFRAAGAVRDARRARFGMRA